jgi:hypothetical protein
MGRIFDLPKASDSDSLTKTIKEITDIKAQFKVIESLEWKCNEYTLVQALLRALPDFYAPLSQLILHGADANAGKLMLEGVISQVRNSEQYYASFGSANPHAHHTAMAARITKAGKPTERAKPKDFDASKGDKWELSWHSTCGSCKRTGHIWYNCRARLAKSDSPNTSACIPPSPSQGTNVSVLPSGQPDGTPSFLRLPTHSASFSNTSIISFQFHVDSAATAHMESKHSLFTRYRTYNPPLIVKLANDDTVLAPGWGFITLALDDNGRHESIELPFLHVPDLWCTLISVSALASEGIFFETDAEHQQTSGCLYKVVQDCTKLYKLHRHTRKSPLYSLLQGSTMYHNLYKHHNTYKQDTLCRQDTFCRRNMLCMRHALCALHKLM